MYVPYADGLVPRASDDLLSIRLVSVRSSVWNGPLTRRIEHSKHSPCAPLDISPSLVPFPSGPEVLFVGGTSSSSPGQAIACPTLVLQRPHRSMAHDPAGTASRILVGICASKRDG